MATRLPNIPRMPQDVHPQVRQAIHALRHWLNEIRLAGGFPASLESVKDAVAELDAIQEEQVLDETFQKPINERIVPPTLTGVAASGAFASIVLSWDTFDWYDGAYVEIWRSTEDDLETAVRVGTVAGGTTWADHPPISSLATPYYYWVRLCSEDGTYGDFNDTAGTVGRAADTPQYVLELLQQSKWKPETEYSAGTLICPSLPNGFVYLAEDDGTSGTSEPEWPTELEQTVEDNDITWTCEAVLTLAPPFTLVDVDGNPQMVVGAQNWTFPSALQSDDYEAGVSGWRITRAGTMEINDSNLVKADAFTDLETEYDELTASAGSTGTVIQDVGTSFDQAKLNDNFRRLADAVNGLAERLESYGEAWNDIAE